MATQEQLFQALRNADAAGDTAAAKRFAQLIQQSRQTQPQTEEQRVAAGLESGAIETRADEPWYVKMGRGALAGPTEALDFGDEVFGEAPPTRAELAQQTGVDTETGAPLGARVGASTSSGTGLVFGDNPEIRRNNIDTLLRDAYGQDVATRTGPVSGELEFQNPETGQWTLFDEQGFTARDVGDFAGDAAVVGGEVAGAVGGGALGALAGPGTAVGGALVGAGVGAGAGEYARQKLGQLLAGTNENVSDSDMLTSAYEVGAVTALLGPLLRGGTNLARSFKTKISGHTPEQEVATLLQDPDTVAKLQQGLQQTVATNRRLAEQEGDDAAAQVLGQLEQKLAANGYDLRSLSKQEADALWANSRYQPTVADVSGDADLLADQTRLMAGGPSTSRPIRQQRERGYGALQRGMERASDVPPEALNKASLSRDIAGEVTGRANRQVAQQQRRGNRLVDLARQRTEGAASRVDDLRQPLPDNATVDRRALGRDLRQNVIQPEREARLGAVRQQYDELETPQAEVAPANLRSTMTAARDEAGRSALASQETRTRQVAEELLSNTQTLGEGGEAIARNLSGEEALATLKSLRSMKREIDRGQLTNADSAVVKRALGALDDDIRAAFPDDYTAAKAAIDAQYRQVQDELERSLIGRITKQQAGKYVINDEFVFDRLIQPGNKTDAAAFSEMMAKPEYAGQRAALRDAFAEKYAREVGKRANQSDKAFQRKHDEFIRKYGAWMEGTFTPAEMADIRKVGTAASKLQRVTQRQKEVERNVERILRSGETRTRQEASNLVGTMNADGAVNPDGVFDRVWGTKGGMAKLRQLKEALGASPALWEQFKARAHADLGEKIFDSVSPRSGAGNTLDEFVNQYRPYLRESFGDQYVSDLRMVADALKRTTTTGAGREGNDKSREFIRSFSRVFFAPPLSARGRAQTAVERFIGSNHREEMAKLLADPRNLRKLVGMKPLGDMTREQFIRRVIHDGVLAYGGFDAARTDAGEG